MLVYTLFVRQKRPKARARDVAWQSGTCGRGLLWKACHALMSAASICNLQMLILSHMVQGEPVIIPCWAAGLVFGGLALLPTLNYHISALYCAWIPQALFRRQTIRRYNIKVCVTQMLYCFSFSDQANDVASHGMM